MSDKDIAFQYALSFHSGNKSNLNEADFFNAINQSTAEFLALIKENKPQTLGILMKKD